MQVNFYGVYRLIAGGKTIEFNLTPNETLLDLLHLVAAKFPVLREEFFDEGGNLVASIPLFLNGRNPRLLEARVNTILQPQDVLSVFSPISSGRINVEDVNQSIMG